MFTSGDGILSAIVELSNKDADTVELIHNAFRDNKVGFLQGLAALIAALNIALEDGEQEGRVIVPEAIKEVIHGMQSELLQVRIKHHIKTKSGEN
jgi:hypothetical protein